MKPEPSNTPPPKPYPPIKPPTSPAPAKLSPDEIDALRRRKREIGAHAREVFKDWGKRAG